MFSCRVNNTSVSFLTLLFTLFGLRIVSCITFCCAEEHRSEPLFLTVKKLVRDELSVGTLSHKTSPRTGSSLS